MGKLHLRKLRLKEIKQHRDRTETLVSADGSIARLVAIVGPNGSGKSGILDGLSWLFTGESAELNKDELISWPGTAEESYMSAEFLFDGDPLELRRDATSATALMKFRGRSYKGVTAVNREIKEQLGIDKDLCQQSMFVRQKQIDDVLFTDPAIRRKAWQRLMGLARAEDVHTAMGNFLSGLAEPVDFDMAMEQEKGRIASYRTAMHKLRRELVPGVPDETVNNLKIDIAGLKERLSLAVRVKKMMLDGARISEELVSLQKAHDLAERAVVSLKGSEAGDMTALNTSITDKTAHVMALRTSIEAFKELDTVMSSLEKAQAELTTSTRELAELESVNVEVLEKQIAELTREMQQAEGEANLLKQLLAPLEKCAGGPKCPLCSSELKDSAGLIGSLKGRIVAQQTTAQKARAALSPMTYTVAATVQKRNACRERLQYWNSSIKQQEGRRDSLVARITAPVEESVLAVEEAELKQLNEHRANLVRNRDMLRRQELAVAEHSSTIRARRDTLFKMSREMDELSASIGDGVTEEILGAGIRSSQDVLDMHMSRLNARHDQIVELAGLRRAVTQSIRALKDLRRRAAMEKVTTDRINILHAVRSFFHYSKGPHLVVSGLLDDITDGVNSMLQYFSSPFIVQPDFDLLDFRCVFIDGREVAPVPPPARKVLSGGEKIELALAFRLASYFMFAARTGIMTLDEPTVYLDDSNVDNFCRLLEKLKKITLDNDLQIIISTHERAVMKQMDFVIDLNPQDKE